MKRTLNLLCVLTLIFSSCEEIENSQGASKKNIAEEVDEKVNILNKITSENGVLKLPDKSSLVEAVIAVKQLSEAEYQNWSRKYNGFESMNSLYSKLIDLEIEASDKMEDDYKNSRVMPNRVHKDLPIHSEETLSYLDLLYIYPEGGVVPLASYYYPGAEYLVNSAGKIIVDGELVEFSNSKMKLGNKKNIGDEKAATTNVSVIKSYQTNPYVQRHMETVGKYRTITDINYYIISRQANYKEYSSTGNVVLRNFRKGFFGWNTRKTTQLKMEGRLYYELKPCGWTGTDPNPPYGMYDCNPWVEGPDVCNPLYGNYYNWFEVSSNGQSVTSIEFYFTEPTENNWYEMAPVPIPMNCDGTNTFGNIKHEFKITGENNYVSYFRNWDFTNNLPVN